VLDYCDDEKTIPTNYSPQNDQVVLWRKHDEEITVSRMINISQDRYCR